MFGNTYTNFSGSRSLNTLSGRKQMYNSTSSSFAKTPNKTSFNIRRSSSTSFKNTQGKLDTLKQDLNYLDSDVHELRQVTKESRLYVKFMKEDLVDRKFVDMTTDLQNKIKILKKTLATNKRSDQARFESVIQTVQQLRRNSKSIMNQLHSLTDRMNRIQNTMGFYSACQKHK